MFCLRNPNLFPLSDQAPFAAHSAVDLAHSCFSMDMTCAVTAAVAKTGLAAVAVEHSRRSQNCSRYNQVRAPYPLRIIAVTGLCAATDVQKLPQTEYQQCRSVLRLRLFGLWHVSRAIWSDRQQVILYLAARAGSRRSKQMVSATTE